MKDTSTIKALDAMCSEYVRRKAIRDIGGCERCKTQKFDIQKENGETFESWKQLQWSHYWGRGKHSVRYVPENAAGICGGCHLYLTAHPQEHTEWFKKRLGEREYLLLEIQAQTPQKLDYEAIRIYLKEKLKEIGE